MASDRFPKKIRNASKDKMPFVLIAGGDDAEAGAVSSATATAARTTACPWTRPWGASFTPSATGPARGNQDGQVTTGAARATPVTTR